jgi:hypothetical protein
VIPLIINVKISAIALTLKIKSIEGLKETLSPDTKEYVGAREIRIGGLI